MTGKRQGASVDSPPLADTRVCVGVIVGAHGTGGQVRIKSFTEDPGLIDSYGPLHGGQEKRSFDVSVVGRAKGVILCAIDGIEDRTQAESLKGETLFVDRSVLPRLEEDAFYHTDLIGLTARFPDGTVVGRVAALHNFGAGDVMELQGLVGGVAMIPFTRSSVPEINLHTGSVVVAVVPGSLEGPLEPGESDNRPRHQPKNRWASKETSKKTRPRYAVEAVSGALGDEEWRG